LFFKIKKGLDIPLKGRPDERIDVVNPVSKAAVLGSDYVGLKPTMLVKEGDSVKAGTPLFEDKKNLGVVVTSPASGTVSAINRGAKRALISVVIDVEGDESELYSFEDLASISAEQVRELLIKSGLWVSMRTRPYGKVPTVDATPNSIFVNAMDTNPLAVDPTIIIDERAGDFATGVSVLAKFDVPVYVCQADGAQLPDLNESKVQIAKFAGKHPAGLSSTHVHNIDPVDGSKSVWTLGYQDVIAIGSLAQTGRIDTTRYVAVAGPLVNSPRVLATKSGANISELVDGRTADGN
jgi:Na+-transporting NADH:ubiquinone oxidoreductase subunit A